MSSLQTEQPIDTRFSIKPTTEEYLEKFILNMMLDYENGSTRDININVGKFLAIKNKICDEFNIRYTVLLKVNNNKLRHYYKNINAETFKSLYLVYFAL